MEGNIKIYKIDDDDITELLSVSMGADESVSNLTAK
jgi:hypothetical protein